MQTSLMFPIENLSDKADNLTEKNAILAKKIGATHTDRPYTMP